MNEIVRVYLECLRLANAVSPPADVVVRADKYYEAVRAKLAPGSEDCGKPTELFGAFGATGLEDANGA